MKICFYGDSIGRGVVFDHQKQRYGYSEHSFAKLLEENGLLEVNNRCKFGCTSGKGLTIMQAEAAKMAEYDYIVMMYGGNDSDYDWPAVAADPSGPDRVKTPIPQFEQNIREMVALVRASGSTPVLLSMVPLDPEKYYRWITKNGGEEGIREFLGSWFRLYRGNEMYNLSLFRLAGELEVPIVDICTPFLRGRDFSDLLCEDGIHPSEKGHRLIFDAVTGYLDEHHLLLKECEESPVALAGQRCTG